jgi:hypothetical protein
MKKHLLMMLTTGAVAVIPLIYIIVVARSDGINLGQDTVTKLTADGSSHINRTGAAPLAHHRDGGATRPDIY